VNYQLLYSDVELHVTIPHLSSLEDLGILGDLATGYRIFPSGGQPQSALGVLDWQSHKQSARVQANRDLSGVRIES